MKTFNYYNPNLKMIFIAKLNWDNTITVKAIKSLKRNINLKSFSYIAGGRYRLYLQEDYRTNKGYTFIFKMNKEDINYPEKACVYISNNITSLIFG